MRLAPLLPATVVLLGGCPSAAPSLRLLAPSQAAPCDVVQVMPELSGLDAGVAWDSSDPLLALERAEDGSVSFQPQPALRGVRYALTATVALPEGEPLSETVEISVPAATPDPGMAPGTVRGCEPFAFGVASGDPTSDGVVLWTRAESSDGPLRWEVRDAEGDALLQAGEIAVDATTDWTARVEVEGLPAGRRLTYRFFTPGGQGSPLGRTRTAPDGPADRFTFAGASCSSLFSGWFNAYRQLVQDDVDVVLHVGDYVYDSVDAQEDLRLTDPPPIDPNDLPQWRERFQLYLTDPDLRAARAAHPWVALWDNHDSDTGSEEGQGTRQAFREYVPMRLPDPADPTRVHRALRWGDLVDLFVVDAYTRKAPEHILGAEQWQWLREGIEGSTAAWRVLGTQKLVTAFGDPSGGFVGDATDWDDWPEARADLFAALAAKGDNLVLSGDLHFTIAADLATDPVDPDAPYDPGSSSSAGVELLAAGITRGNFDETICGGPCDDAGAALIENIRARIYEENPHHAFVELVEHGYGRVTITPERATATMRFFPIRFPTDDELPGQSLVVERGANRWTR